MSPGGLCGQLSPAENQRPISPGAMSGTNRGSRRPFAIRAGGGPGRCGNTGFRDLSAFSFPWIRPARCRPGRLAVRRTSKAAGAGLVFHGRPCEHKSHAHMIAAQTLLQRACAPRRVLPLTTGTGWGSLLSGALPLNTPVRLNPGYRASSSMRAARPRQRQTTCARLPWRALRDSELMPVVFLFPIRGRYTMRAHLPCHISCHR